jgi:hypothetical protein
MSSVALTKTTLHTNETADGIRSITSLLGRAFTVLLRAPAGF